MLCIDTDGHVHFLQDKLQNCIHLLHSTCMQIDQVLASSQLMAAALQLHSKQPRIHALQKQDCHDRVGQGRIVLGVTSSYTLSCELGCEAFPALQSCSSKVTSDQVGVTIALPSV